MRKPPLLTLLFLSLILNISIAQGGTTGDDINCLRTLKATISDPNGYLNSWNLTNTTKGSICKFNGIDCWNQNENRVLNIRLSNMGLKGHFPSGLQLCESLTGLDLSSNSFTGSIPENISTMVCNLQAILYFGHGTCLGLYQHPLHKFLTGHTSRVPSGTE
jgi:Leucine rich repeat N-terminal domain